MCDLAATYPNTEPIPSRYSNSLPVQLLQKGRNNLKLNERATHDAKNSEMEQSGVEGKSVWQMFKLENSSTALELESLLSLNGFCGKIMMNLDLNFAVVLNINIFFCI